jgi:hypothetical protein
MQLHYKKNPFKKYVQPPLSKETKAEILHRWRFSKNNSIPEIAAEFKVTHFSINRIIDSFLSTKSPK